MDIHTPGHRPDAMGRIQIAITLDGFMEPPLALIIGWGQL
jgi:hypothetical protein